MSFSASVDDLVRLSSSPLVRAAASWERVALGSVADILNGYPWKSAFFNEKSGPAVIRIRDVTSGKTDTRYSGDVVDGYWIEDGDLLVGMDGDFNTRVWKGGRALLNQRVCRVSANSQFYSSSFLSRVLPGYLQLIHDETHSITVKHLSSRTLAEIPLPLPPLPEQQRIVAKIDSLTGKSRRARDHLDHIPRLVEKYKQAVLTEAFSGNFSPDLDVSFFEPLPLETVTASTFYGPRIGQEAYVKAGIPTLRTTDIADWGRVEPQGPPQVKVSQADFSKWGLQHGDLMVTRTGTIGKCAVYDDAMGPALPSAYLIRVRLKLNEVDPRFAVLFLLSPSGQRQLLDGRTAVAQPNINAHAITSVQLPLPPIAYQRKIAERVESMFLAIDRLASEATSARKLIDRLDQAVLAKAFRGELVPQDPADEPASALLERIKAERGNAPKQKRRGSS